MLTLCAALLLHVALSSAGDPCPPSTALVPCTCTYLPVWYNGTEMLVADATTTPAPASLTPMRRKRDTSREQIVVNETFYTVVDCDRPKSLQALEDTVSNALNRKLVDKLRVARVPPLKEHTLARLPSGWLKHVRVRHFEVRDSQMSGDFLWYGNPFEGQSASLLWMSANRCLLTGSLTYDTIGSVHTKGLHALPNIEGVDFSDNRLTAITAASFRHPPTNLTVIILSRNSIQYVEPGAFHHVPLLQILDLSHNLLESLVRGILQSPARHLRNINLSWNSLTSLPSDFFSNLPALKTVNLAHNFLYSMPAKPWQSVWKQLTLVNVTNNFVRCDCDLLWLLPILSPHDENSTTTPAPTPLPGQTVVGDCSQILDIRPFGIRHDLVTLTRDRLNC